MLTVLMPTYNRAAAIVPVLERFCGLTSPPGGWRMLIVDNGSTDSTREVVHSFEQRLPVTYLFEETPGKRSAVNKALDHVEGDLVVMTDDDVLPVSHWLVHYRNAADALASYDIFGGPVVPRWPYPPPRWATFNPKITSAVFAAKPLDTPSGPAGWGDVLGPNFAFRTRILEAGHRFDRRTSANRADVALGDESEFLLRLSKHGYTFWFLKDAVVEHIIRPEQLNRKWVLRRGLRTGRAFYRMGAAENPAPAMLFGAPRYAYGLVVKHALRMLGALCRGNLLKAFEEQWQLYYYIGCVAEGRIVHGHRRAPRD